jgi:GxxExxY protein
MRAVWRWIAAHLTTAIASKTSAPPATTDTLSGIPGRVIACAQIVAKSLGPGLPEIIYENALAFELRKTGLTVGQQRAVAVYYDGAIVGDYTADLLVENAVLVEMKAVRTSSPAHIAQCGRYLKATGLTLCLMFDFDRPRLKIKRVARGP